MTSRLNARNPLCIPNEAHKCEHAVISTKGAEGVGVGAQQLSLVLTGGACISMANPPAMPSRVAHFVLISLRSRPCFVSPPVLFRFLSLSLSVSLSQSVACLCPCETHWAMAISISGQRWTEGVDSTWKIKPKKKKNLIPIVPAKQCTYSPFNAFSISGNWGTRVMLQWTEYCINFKFNSKGDEKERMRCRGDECHLWTGNITQVLSQVPRIEVCGFYHLENNRASCWSQDKI